MNTNQKDLTARIIQWLIGNVKLALAIISTVVANSIIFIVVQGPFALFRRYYRRKVIRNEPLYVEDIPFTKKLSEEQMQENAPAPPSPPKHFEHAFKSRVMRLGRYPIPNFTLRYRHPPISGKILAGIGETQPRRIEKFFHKGYRHIYGALNQADHMILPKEPVLRTLQARWDNRHSRGPVAVTQRLVEDPAAMSAELKEKAKSFGASLAGCTEVLEEAVYANCEDYLPHAIVLGAPMNRQKVLETPSVTSIVAIIDGYVDVGRAAVELAKYIRRLGWQAEADTNLGNAPSKVMHIPLAVSAGLGQMGRHTSLITKELGANVRLATVLTDIPLEFDRPVDIGVEDLCHNCSICAQNCPPQAIYEEKKMVRGVKKWHLDFDRCTPYFTENYGCGICIQVCPWSESGVGPLLSNNLLQSRQLRASYLPEQREAEESSFAQVSAPKSNEAIAVEEISVVENFWLEVIVERMEIHPGRIVEVVFKSADPNRQLPDFSAGAHTEVKLPSGKVRAYTISNAPPGGGRYRLAVKVEEDGKGGSIEFETLSQGQQLMVKRPGNNFLLKEDSQHYFLVAGGIGITPMVAFANRLQELGKPFEVHYSVKAREQAIFASELEGLASGRLYIHKNRQWLSDLFDHPPAESAVYVCGPRGMMDAVTERAIAGGIPKLSVFREDFGSSNPDKSFQLVLASTGQSIAIEPGQTIARVLNDQGIFVPVSCGYGICGVCTAHVLDGEPDARDSVYSDEEKKTKITLCCSRSLSEKLVIDL